MGVVRILHLSDLRWPASDLLLRAQAEALIEALRGLTGQGLKPDLVAVTGDLTAPGDVGGLAGVEALLRRVVEAVGLSLDQLLIVAGEADVDPAQVEGAASYIHRGLLENGAEAINKLLASEKQRALMLCRLDRWLGLANRLRGERPALKVPWWSDVVPVRGQRVGVAGLCTAWAATGGAEEPGLLVGAFQVGAVVNPIDSCDLRIGLLHHPPGGLHEVDSPTAQALGQRLHVLLRGHSGEPEWSSRHSPWQDCVELVGGPLFGEGRGDFALVEVSDTAVRVRPYTWSRGAWVPDRTGADHRDGVVTLPRGGGLSPANTPTLPPPGALRLKPPPTFTEDNRPKEPWPLLAPYTHPAHLGGRDAEIDELLSLLRGPHLIVSLYATSGAGKSSLLQAGLLPRLAAAGVPVVYNRQPAVRTLGADLLAGLLEDPPTIEEGDWRGLAGHLRQIRGPGGQRPVLILDQFEELFLAGRAPGWLGPLVAATEVAPGGRACRWVLAYRHEFHGRVLNWLRDPFSGSALSAADRQCLPRSLHPADIQVAWPLYPLGHREGLAADAPEVAGAFEEAIHKPLRGSRSRWRIEASAVSRLASAFARARRDNREAPLTPELQVVLRRLQRRAVDGWLRVPEEAGAADRLIKDAIADHVVALLTEVAEAVDPEAVNDRRSDALLLLAGLTDDQGRRRPLPLAELLKAGDGHDGRLIEALRANGVWLILCEKRDGIDHATLPHDHVAQAIHRLASDPAESLRFGLDPVAMELWRFAVGRTAAFGRGDLGAVEVDDTRLAAIGGRAALLLRDEAMRRWWAGAQQAGRRRQREELVSEVRSSEERSGRALRALHQLRVDHGLDGAALAEVLAVGRPGDAFNADRRDALFGLGPAGLTEEERASLLPPLVLALAPAVEPSDHPEALYGALLAALDAVRPREAATEAMAAVVAAMRAGSRGSPAPIDPEDGAWSPVVAGTFEVGRFPEERMPGGDDERLHSVTLSPYRMARLVVTLAEYRAFARAPHAKPEWRGEWPAIQVSWYDARAYAAWRGAALPTEHQWEVACRGGGVGGVYTKTLCYAGNRPKDLNRCAVHEGNRERVLNARPLMDARDPVASAPPHPLGLVHIHGNVYEWTRDWHEEAYPETRPTDPVGPASAPPPVWRVIRGGSWSVPAAFARSACRGAFAPSGRSSDMGFRLVLPQPVGHGP